LRDADLGMVYGGADVVAKYRGSQVLPQGPGRSKILITADTDWRQILMLYQLLEVLAPGPIVSLNRAVAVAMVHGPQAGLELIATLDSDDRLSDHHRLAAVRAHLLEQSGDRRAARAAYQAAAKMTTSLPEQRYLESRAARLS